VITSVNTTNTGEVTVNWNSVPGGAGYRIYILQYPWSWYDIRHQAIRPPGSTSHTFTGVASGAYNVFIVTEPNNRYIQSVWHTFEVVTSDRAVITSVNATSYGRVTVNWNSVPGGEGYRIYIIQYPWSWNDIRHQAVRPPGTTSHTFTGVANGEYNVFIVTQPNNRYIQSVWRTFEVRPPARAVITGVNVSGRNVTVNWNSVPGVASYDIYIIQAPWSWNDIRHHANRVPGTTSHTFTGLLPGRYYVFIVTRPNDRYTQSIWHRIDIS
ncbi:MAG: fibronectin type III domain-containing protein, partial [Oscillospiraceae bacterium]|nr:fibronectin type III domain-containing protein [Oscillospiraceae bacterium]